jgi:hypothetical protein
VIWTRKQREAEVFTERLQEVSDEIEGHEPEIVDVRELDAHLRQPAHPLAVPPADIAAEP